MSASLSVLSSLNFGVLSPAKIREISVVEVTTDELYENGLMVIRGYINISIKTKCPNKK